MDTAPSGTTADAGITVEELQLATRNHGMPLEALAYDDTPVGLHYLLIHYDIPVIDTAAWRLRLGGLVARPLELSLADVRARPRVTTPVTMECAGNGRARLRPRAVSQPWLHEAVGNAAWTGTPLAPLLDEAGVDASALTVVFTGADRGVEGGEEQAYERGLTLEQVRDRDPLLAYEINGQPLPPQHGAPLRLIVPGWYGMASVKWLERITVTAEPFEGYQQARAYRLRQEPDEAGVPVDRIAVRSLMVPPGIPEFLSRERLVDRAASPIELRGRAWSGDGEIVAVEVSDDGGRTWRPATLGGAAGRHSWHGWTFSWAPGAPGTYELCCRATDAAGNTQPLEGSWNLGGYAVNAVQRVTVTVRP